LPVRCLAMERLQVMTAVIWLAAGAALKGVAWAAASALPGSRRHVASQAARILASLSGAMPWWTSEVPKLRWSSGIARSHRHVS